jgi:uncharacterized protein with HEPN domain
LSAKRQSHIPKSLRQQHPQIPWPQIIGTRNRLVHGYDLVDYDIIWSTIAEDLPPLIAELEKIL